jgi:hypothetical protein
LSNIISVVEGPREQVKTLALRIKSARQELIEHPSYNNARIVQKLVAERNQLIHELRSKITLAYAFERTLVEEMVDKYA